MITLHLERWCYGIVAPDGTLFPTLGRLHANGLRTLYTVEDPWNHNTRGASCVPDGVYDLVPHSTDAHPHTWALLNPALGIYHEPGDKPPGVFGRWACLLHPGNDEGDVEGCICPGLHPCLSPWLGVQDSRDAMDLVRDYIGSAKARLIIQPAPGARWSYT
ncbi:MAG TPA: DUF5675 family protein [Gammaproteobacteria bacterium]|nr:DUF5675 family protein [Gammaproteobacteria bacterium]